MEKEAIQNGSATITPRVPTQMPKVPKQKSWLLVGAVALILFFLGIAGFFAYRNFKLEKGSKYTCNLIQIDCQRLEDYQNSGWNINKVKVEPGYENFPNEVIILSKKIFSFPVNYSIVISKEDKKIISRLPESLIFNNILQEAQKDNLLISLLDTGKPFYVQIIDRKLLPWEEGGVHKSADYFEFIAEFSVGKDSFGVGCTKSYFIQFTESGEILKHEVTEPYCPGPI